MNLREQPPGTPEEPSFLPYHGRRDLSSRADDSQQFRNPADFDQVGLR
jgi:hypothetical protein